MNWSWGEALACQKVGHTPNNFGPDQKISTAHFGHNPNAPLETEAKIFKEVHNRTFPLLTPQTRKEELQLERKTCSQKRIPNTPCRMIYL